MAIDLVKRTRGRPPKLTDEVWTILVDRVRRNNYISVVCQAAGIDTNTLTNYMSHAKDCNDYIRVNDLIDQLPESYKEVTEDIYNLFPADLQDKLVYWYLFKDLKRAEAQGTIELSDMVRDAGPKNWLAAMTLLERRHPDMYGRREAVDVSVQAAQDFMQAAIKALKEPDRSTPANRAINETL
jgi:hypothetical protein